MHTSVVGWRYTSIVPGVQSTMLDRLTLLTNTVHTVIIPLSLGLYVDLQTRS